jgi:hypothetical protein
MNKLGHRLGYMARHIAQLAGVVDQIDLPARIDLEDRM